MVSSENTKDFKSAGITSTPTSIAQYTADLQKLAKSGVDPHPLDIPLQAQEGLSTYWYETTAAFGVLLLFLATRGGGALATAERRF